MTTATAPAGKPSLLTPLRRRDFALFMGAFTTSAIGTWAYNVALVVWLIDTTGSAGWVSISIACRFIPALLFSAYGGVLAERFERVGLMRNLDVICGTINGVMAGAMFLDAPPAVVVATAAMTSTVGIAYEPAAAAMTPLLVPERELGAANALRNTVDNVCVVAGPGLGALVLLLGEPWVALLVNAATFFVSALMVSAVRSRSTKVDVTEGGEVGPLRQMLVGIRTIVGSSTAGVLVAFSVIATGVFGIDSVLFVVLSDDVLGTGPEAYGYLLAGLGVGGILAAPLVTRAERAPLLGPVILIGMAAYCLPTLLFLTVDSPTVAFVAQVIRGAGTLFVDVLAITALQRSLTNDLLGRVFGAFDALCLLAILAGSALVPLVIHAFGLDAMLWISGLGIPLACLAGWPWLARMDRAAHARRAELAPRMALLEGCHLFDDVGEGALDQLAGASEFVDIAPGAVVITEGEPADSFYVIESGTFAVTSTGTDQALADMLPNAWFGEIGLIEAVPRTATVTARTDGRLLRVDGEAFIDALTQTAPSAALIDGASVRLRRTHPARTLTRGGLPQEPD